MKRQPTKKNQVLFNHLKPPNKKRHTQYQNIDMSKTHNSYSTIVIGPSGHHQDLVHSVENPMSQTVNHPQLQHPCQYLGCQK